MFGNRTESGRNNIAGIAIHNRRKALGISQREVADRLRSHGLVIDKNAAVSYTHLTLPTNSLV